MDGNQKDRDMWNGRDRKIHLSAQKGDLAWKSQDKYTTLKKEWNLIVVSV